MVDIVRLSREVDNDPLSRGYSGMTAQQVADSLNTADRSVMTMNVSGSTVYNSIDPAEFQALTETQQRLIRDIFSLGDVIDVGPGTNARQVLIDIFGGTSNTIVNIAAALTTNITRAQELRLLGASREIGPAHVVRARG